MYCFDTDVLSAAMRGEPALHLVRRLASTPSEQQFTTAITLGELAYGAAKRESMQLAERVRDLIRGVVTVLPFDVAAAQSYAELRVRLEREGRPLDDPDLRIASIALARDLTLVTGNVRHFARVPGLRVENWLEL